MANVNHNIGMHINLVFENSTPAMSRFMLSELGMPFARPEVSNKKA
jgi:ribosomal protein L5